MLQESHLESFHGLLTLDGMEGLASDPPPWSLKARVSGLSFADLQQSEGGWLWGSLPRLLASGVTGMLELPMNLGGPTPEGILLGCSQWDSTGGD